MKKKKTREAYHCLLRVQQNLTIVNCLTQSGRFGLCSNWFLPPPRAPSLPISVVCETAFFHSFFALIIMHIPWNLLWNTFSAVRFSLSYVFVVYIFSLSSSHPLLLVRSTHCILSSLCVVLLASIMSRCSPCVNAYYSPFHMLLLTQCCPFGLFP